MKLRNASLVLIAILFIGCAKDVSIYTIPSGSIITIDDEEYITPVNFKLKEGLYKVKAELDGYESEFFNINVSKESVRFSHYLTPEKIRFDLEIYPTDSEAYLGDQKLVNGSNKVVPGSYTLKVSKTAYRTYKEDIVIDLNTDVSRNIILEQFKKVTVNMNYSDPLIKGIDPEEFSSIEFYSGGESYLLNNINDLKLELGKEHKIELRESGETLKSFDIPAGIDEITIDINSFNEASYIVESALNSEYSIDVSKALKRLFIPDEDTNSIYGQYSNYFIYLYSEYRYDILLTLLSRGSFDTINGQDLYEPLLKNDDLDMFVKLEEAGAEKLPTLIYNIIENKAYECLNHVLKSMKEDEINSKIVYKAVNDFRGGHTYNIFLTHNDSKAFDMFLKYGARTDVREVMKYYDFDSPGTIIKTTEISKEGDVYIFHKSEHRKDFK